MSSFVKFSSKLEIMLAYNYLNDEELWIFDTIFQCNGVTLGILFGDI